MDVTGVIMAVEVENNRNREPHNPSDYLIQKAVMKCADGNLYLADFDHQILVQSRVKGLPPPSHEAFGEGDVVTVVQTGPMDKWEPLKFEAFYTEAENHIIESIR